MGSRYLACPFPLDNYKTKFTPFYLFLLLKCIPTHTLLGVSGCKFSRDSLSCHLQKRQKCSDFCIFQSMTTLKCSCCKVLVYIRTEITATVALFSQYSATASRRNSQLIYHHTAMSRNNVELVLIAFSVDLNKPHSSATLGENPACVKLSEGGSPLNSMPQSYLSPANNTTETISGNICRYASSKFLFIPGPKLYPMPYGFKTKPNLS